MQTTYQTERGDFTYREDLDEICHMPLTQFQRERPEIEARLTPQDFQSVLAARRIMNEDF